MNQLIKHDFYLLEHDLHERTITHRLAIYLEAYFPDWHVDCEYNKNLEDVKRVGRITSDLMQFYKDIPLKANDNEISDEQSVYPDIIVHRRGTRDNLLAIEVKKANRDRHCDIKKLCRYQQDLEYQYAKFLTINIGPVSQRTKPYQIIEPSCP